MVIEWHLLFPWWVNLHLKSHMSKYPVHARLYIASQPFRMTNNRLLLIERGPSRIPSFGRDGEYLFRLRELVRLFMVFVMSMNMATTMGVSRRIGGRLA